MSKKATCHIGTSGWSYDAWDEKFYPSDIPKTKWFKHYTENFDTVEMNATFYRGFKEKTFKKWYDEAPENFRYVFKANRVITHRKYLKNVSDNVKRFCESVNLVKEKLGMVLLQLHPKTVYDLNMLKEAIIAFDDPSRVAVEFRDEKWLNDDVYRLLEDTGSVFSNVDSPQFKVLDITTANRAYFRYHGRGEWYNYNYSENDLHELAEGIEKVANGGCEEIYVYFNNDVNAHAPNNALKLKEIVNKNFKDIEAK